MKCNDLLKSLAFFPSFLPSFFGWLAGCYVTSEARIPGHVPRHRDRAGCYVTSEARIPGHVPRQRDLKDKGFHNASGLLSPHDGWGPGSLTPTSLRCSLYSRLVSFSWIWGDEDDAGGGWELAMRPTGSGDCAGTQAWGELQRAAISQGRGCLQQQQLASVHAGRSAAIHPEGHGAHGELDPSAILLLLRPQDDAARVLRQPR